MKKLLFFVVLIGQFGLAQVSRNPGDFRDVKVFDRISVELIPSNENKVEVFGNRSNEVEIVNNNGELKIRMSLKKLLDGEEVEAKVYYTKLGNIDATEGSFVSSAQTIKQPSLNLNVKEGAEIKLTLEVDRIGIRAVTGGIVRLTGNAEKSDIRIGTGGIVRAKELVTLRTAVNINAGGDADVNASETVDADIKAGGTVTVFGQPKQINKKTTLGGTIRESN